MDGYVFMLATAGGLLAGLAGALMGIGGGIVAVPFLNLFLGVPIHSAAAAGLVSTLAVSCGAAGRYLRLGLVEVRAAMRFELFAAAGGLLGGIAVGWLRGFVVQLLFAVVLAYASWQVVLHAGPAEGRAGRPGGSSPRRTLAAYLLCFAAGVVSGLLGIGGGIVVVPVLHLVLALPFKNATATSNFMMGLTAVPALCGFVSRGDLDLSLTVPLAAGVLLGANLGAGIMPRLRTRTLKVAFGLLLAITALEMARQGIGAC